MPTPHVISKRSFCTTGSIWLPQKSCAEEVCLMTANAFDRQRVRDAHAACKARDCKRFAHENLVLRFDSREPEHNFLLHQISKRPTLLLSPQTLFLHSIP